MDLETTENTSETTTRQNVANFVVLGFAVIGAYQTTKYAIVKTKAGLRALKDARTQQSPSES